MAERSTISQSVQLGVETTPGVAVEATRRLGSVGISLGINAEINTQRPIGQKYAAAQNLLRESAMGSIEGVPAYTELQYLLASVLSTPTVTPIANGATADAAALWTFDSATFGEDDPITFTVEQGSAKRAHRSSNCIVTELTMAFGTDELSIGGSVLAKAIEDGITLTPDAVQGKQVTIRPNEINLYLDDTAATLGTTKLTRGISGEISISDRFGPVWVLDRAQKSFATTVETEPSVEFKLNVQADEQGMIPLEAMRTGQTKFFRLEAVGPIIFGATETATRYKLVIDLAGQVSSPNDFADEDGVYAIEWGFGVVHDATWGKALHVELTNDVKEL